MFKNYLYLRRCIDELNIPLKGKTIYEIYSQEKNKLFLNISNQDFPDRHLIISIDSSIPYFQIKETHHKAKKNTVDFFSKFLPAEINNISISGDDRIIKISTSNGDLAIFIRGGSSQIIYKNNNDIETFLNSSHVVISELIDEMNNFKHDFEIEIQDFILLSDLKSKFSFVNNAYIVELKNRVIDFDSAVQKDLIFQLFNEILFGKIKVGYNLDLEKMIFAPETFSVTKNLINSKIFEDYHSAISYFISLKYRTEKLMRLKSSILKFIGKEISVLTKKLNNLKIRIESGSKEYEYRKYGQLLLSNIYKLEKGQKEIELEDFETQSLVKIKLDPKLDPSQNAERYFDKSKDEKINYKISSNLFQTAKSKYDEFISLENSVNLSDDLIFLEQIASDLKIIKTKKMDHSEQFKIKYRHYVIEDKYHVYVGRDSQSNDLLTTKFAKQNDLWFHARGVSGSHTVLRIENSKEAVPKNIIKQTASIAAFYSKAKTAKMVPVAYTFRKFVQKRKGMAPGKVLLSREEVVIVSPEIPKTAVYIED